jgi:hypothetical protein
MAGEPSMELTKNRAAAREIRCFIIGLDVVR